MEERKYEVHDGNRRVAFGMSLDNALLFIRAYFEKYYMERGMEMSVHEMEPVSEVEGENRQV